MNINRTSMYRQMSNYQAMSSMMMPKVNGGSVTSIPKLDSSTAKKLQGSLSADSVNYVRQYQSEISGLRNAANALRNTGTANTVASSSNTKVAEIASSYQSGSAGSYEVDVKQLAAAQVNRSTQLDASGTDFTGDLALTTTAGNFTFATSPSATNNLDAMNQMARDINAAKTGVNATVSVKDGKATLELAATKTGESAAFQVNGSAAVSVGMTQATQKAQNAQYTVKSAGSSLAPSQRSSESNTVDIDSTGRIRATLKGAGTANVGATADNSKTADGIQKLAEHYNSTLKLLNNNADRGTGGLTQMKRMLIATGNEKSMSQLGLTSNKDGTLTFDRAKYLKNAAESPSMTRESLGGSFGLATRLYNSADRGLGQSSSQLLSQDLKTAKMEQAYASGIYGRSGNINQSAYQSVGALFNLLV